MSRQAGRPRWSTVGIACVVSCICVAGGSLAAELGFQYAAKVVCGVQKDPRVLRLAPGLYATTVNVHNPNGTTVRFRKKVSLTYPPGLQKPGKVQRISEDVLEPDQALESSCVDLRERVFSGGSLPPYFEGFLVLESPESLDVTAVYTTGPTDARTAVNEPSSIDVEQVPERRVGSTHGQADLLPVPDPNGNICVMRGDDLVVTIRNQGASPAGSSITEVDFGTFGRFSKPTPALAPGASTQLLFAIPRTPNCFDPDCSFTITSDVQLDVPESNEANNRATGTCIG